MAKIVVDPRTGMKWSIIKATNVSGIILVSRYNTGTYGIGGESPYMTYNNGHYSCLRTNRHKDFKDCTIHEYIEMVAEEMEIYGKSKQEEVRPKAW